MSKINRLSDEIISKVAAGEIIEHPASVVKELIENSIDANATNINIEIQDIGLQSIKVTDNGEGIEKEDLLRSYKRHYTSKLSDSFTLSDINTLGYRGEALYSIASISNTTIKSKTKSNIAGHEIKITNGKHVQEALPVGMAQGTCVIVEDLFKNLPARKAFYENKTYENKQIINTVIALALGNLHISFKLRINNKTVLLLPVQKLIDRISYIMGEEISKHLIEIKHKEEHLELHGYISKPQKALATKEFQHLFVNTRYVEDRELERLTKNSYGSLIEKKSHPIFVFNLKIPQDTVDVNIHPRKKEILFLNKDYVFANIQKAVSEALGIADITYKLGESDDFEEFIYSKSQKLKDLSQAQKGNKYIAKSLKNEGSLWNLKTDDQEFNENEILQVHQLYLLMESKEGLIMIDQHAAHERILYEEFLRELKNSTLKKERVKTNKLVEFPINLLPTLEKHVEEFKKLNIYIEPFRNNTYKVTEIPSQFLTHDLQKLLIEIMTDLEEFGNFQEDDLTMKTLAFLACRTAIKSGDYLTMQERKNLIKKLRETKTGYTCPHGRPVMINITKNELEKMFKRK